MTTIKNNRVSVSILWLFFIIASLSYIRSNINIVSDIQQFMPTDSNNKRLQVLLHETTKGTASNLILVQLAGESPEYLTNLSKQLKHSLLLDNNLFESISNGDNIDNTSSFEPLMEYRYLLSKDNDFSVNTLREHFKGILTVLRNGLSGEMVNYLFLDPTRTLASYLVAQSKQIKTNKVNGVWFLSEQSKALLTIQLKSTGFNLDVQQASINTIKNTFEKLDTKNKAEIILSGSSIIAVAIRDSIMETTRQVSWVLAFIILLLFWYGYRSIRLAFVASIPLATAIVIAISVTQLIFNEVHGIVLAFGITMLGVCLDYPLHLFSHLKKGESTKKTLNKIWPTLRLGVITSILAYIALIGTGFSGLTQLAVFSAVGLLTALFVTRWLLPEWVDESWTNKRQFFISYPLRYKYKIILSLFIIVLPISILIIHQDIWSNDISQISPVPVDLRETDRDLRRALNATDLNHLFLIEGEDVDEVLRKTENLTSAIEPAIKEGVLTGTYSAADIFPSKINQKRTQSLLPNKQMLSLNVTAAMKGLGFKENAFDSFINSVAKSKTQPTVDYEKILLSPLAVKLKSLLFKQDTNWYSIIRVTGVNDEAVFKAWLKDSPNIGQHYMSIRGATNVLMNQYLQSAWLRFLGVLTLVIFIVFWLSHRRKSTIWLLIPVVAGVVVSMTVQVLLGHLINIFHILSLLLVIGMGLDYSLFFNRDWTSVPELQERTHAIIISAITTMAAFGILGLSNIPILSAMGQTVSVGIITCFVIAQRIAVPKIILQGNK